MPCSWCPATTFRPWPGATRKRDYLPVLTRRTRITIDYTRCGDGVGVDPRECCRCLKVCAPAVFLLHETLGVREHDPFDPQKWRVTPMWASLCDACMECVEACPRQAVRVKAGSRPVREQRS
jgi:NAD-dependent dihydropyrimidine dehydrogenase PreA subunit